MKAYHNKDYSVVKTFKAGRKSRLFFFMESLWLSVFHVSVEKDISTKAFSYQK
jgi:hypothetical protein